MSGPPLLDCTDATPAPSADKHPPYGVLVLPGGTGIGLEVRRSLSDLKEIRLVGAGSADDRHGPFAYRNWAQVPSVHEDGWQAAVNEGCPLVWSGLHRPGAR
jgi:hypothetical protein